MWYKLLNYSDETENLCFQVILQLACRNVGLKIIKLEVIFGTCHSSSFSSLFFSSCFSWKIYLLLCMLSPLCLANLMYSFQFSFWTSFSHVSSDSLAYLPYRSLRSHAMRDDLWGWRCLCVHVHIAYFTFSLQGGGTERAVEVGVSSVPELGWGEHWLS